MVPDKKGLRTHSGVTCGPAFGTETQGWVLAWERCSGNLGLQESDVWKVTVPIQRVHAWSFGGKGDGGDPSWDHL